jgi:zinc/manganese transport system substrate-binding protein
MRCAMSCTLSRRAPVRSAWLALLLALAAVSACRADEPLRVAVTLPYLADVARAVGGDQVRVDVLVRPGADPHSIEATPAHIATLREADVFVENGMQLEEWAARALESAQNARLLPGQPGHVFAATGVAALEVPTPQMLAGGGDVHRAGSPHVWLDPLNLEVVARNVEVGLSAVRPGSAAAFEQGRKAFEARIDEAYFGPELLRALGATQLRQLARSGGLRAFLQRNAYRGHPLADLEGGWLAAARSLEGTPVISYHRTWAYAAAAFGFTVTSTVEERPGLAPSPAYLERLQASATQAGVKVVVVAPYEPASRAEAVAEPLGGAAVVLPTQPGETEGTADVFAMFDAIVRLLVDAKRRTTR